MFKGIITVNAYITTALASSIILAVCEYYFPEKGFSTLFAITPALIAFAFARFDPNRPLKSLGWRPNFLFWLEIVIVVAIMTAVLLLIAWLFGHIAINEKALKKFLKFSTLLELMVGIAINTGEEAGWRGYMFPKLYEKSGWWPAVLTSAVVWWAWHIPFMAVLQLRQFGEIQWGTQAIQLASMFPVTVLFSYWFLRSQSFWAIGFAHQIGNFVNKWFLGLEHAKKNPIFFADQSFAYLYSLENGILGFGVLLTMATFIYTRNKQFLLLSGKKVR